MAQLKSGKAQEFDSIVIGGGLSGLIVAHQLEGAGRKVALVDALDVLGGNCRPYKSAIGFTDHGFKFFPSSAAALSSLQWLESILGEPIGIQEIDAPPVTYDNGKFQPFIGFGDFSPEAASELDYFASPKRLITEKTPKDWVTRLSETFMGEVFLQSHLTRLQFEDGFIIEALLNGTKKVSAREYVVCAPPTVLGAVLPDTALSTRNRMRLTKGKFFTAIYLDIIHGKPVTESRQLHVLKGGSEEPLVGVFQPAITNEAGQAIQQSQWVTFVRADMTDDAEATATALKMIKRQIKRVYEHAIDGIVSERILVTPASHGEIEGFLSEDQRFPKIDNLWVSSNFFNPNRNLVGTLDQAQRVLANFNEQPLVTDIEETTPQGPSITM